MGVKVSVKSLSKERKRKKLSGGDGGFISKRLKALADKKAMNTKK